MTAARQRGVAFALLAVTLAAGAFLRLESLGVPSYWLDEILHQQLTEDAMRQPWWRWISGFSAEHGPLYYLTQLITHRPHAELAGRLPAALFGVATIGLVWLAARKLEAFYGLAAIASAGFIALSPLHVYYSREARAYGLLMFLTAALLAALLHSRTALVPSILLLAITYTTAAAAPVIAAVFAVSLLAALMNQGPTRRRYAVVALAAGAALAVLPLLYASRPAADATWPRFPEIDFELIAGIIRGLSVSALDEPTAGRAAALLLCAAIIGGIAAWKRDRTTGVILTGMTLLPLLVSLAALRLLDHFYAVRYIAPAVVGFTILAGTGVAAAAVAMARLLRLERGAYAVALLLVLGMVAGYASKAWSAARHEAFQKLDWRAVAAMLRSHVRPGDVILAAEPWSEVSLRYYLGEIPGVKLIGMRGPGIAEIVTDRSPAAWLISAGASADESVRQWMCRYPLLLASPLERLRLHYAPSERHFLQSRSKAPEQRAMAVALGARGFWLRMGADDERFLGTGWAGAEGSGNETFRWAIGRQATLLIPRGTPADRTIRLEAHPLHAPSLPAQQVRIALNDRELGTVVLAAESTTYAVQAPARAWVEGLNTVTFDFDRAMSPASLNPASHDLRELAAAFRRVGIEDAGFTAPPLHVPFTASMRLGGPLVPPSRSLSSRFPIEHLRPQPVEALLGRLGLDPVATWDALNRRTTTLDSLLETIAYGSGCEDDRAFLKRAFAILLQRQPNQIEVHDLLRRMRAGATREHIVGRIARADDFVKQLE